MPAFLLPALAGLAGGVANSQAQAQQNRDSQIYSKQMYEVQKQDNLKFWNMQNEYNSPEQQMARFRKAGLNPNLIYGQGNSGPAGNVQTPDVQPVQFRSPEWGNGLQTAGLALMNQYDIDIKQATRDNLLDQNTVIEQEKLLKMAQTLATLTGAERQKFQLEFDRELRNTSADFRKAQLKNMIVGTDLAINRDRREERMTTSNINEAAQRVANMKIQNATSKLEQDRIRENISLMRQDGRLKDFDIKLREKGIMPGDPMYARMISTYLTDQFGPGGIKKTFDDIWNALFK